MFAVANTYDELFVSNAPAVDVFEIKSSKKDLEIAAGVIAQDELQITADEALIKTTDDQDAFDLFCSSRNADNRVFCAVFINMNTSSVECTFDNADFLGVINSDMKGKASRWSGLNYSSAPNPVWEWSAHANTFGEVLLDQFTAKELIEGKKNGATTIIPKITLEWIAANVADYVGWYKYTPSSLGVERKGVYNQLVDLGVVINKLIEQFQIGLENTGLPDYTVVIDDFHFDFKFIPSQPQEPPVSDFAGNNGDGFLMCGEFTVDKEYKPPFTDISQALKPDIENPKNLQMVTSNDAKRIYAHWRMFQPKKNEEKLSLISTNNFLGLLHGIAYSFGMLVETYNSSPNTLHVRFISRQNMVRWRVYPVGATSDDVDLKRLSSQDKLCYAYGSQYTVDGIDIYVYDNQSGSATPSEKLNNITSDGTQLPFSISRSLCQRSEFFLKDPISKMLFYLSRLLPHNGTLLEYRNSQWNGIAKTAGISTALYMSVPNTASTINLPSEVSIITPIAQIAVFVDNQQLLFDSLSQYSNYMSSRAGGYYEFERTLDVPFLCGFSLSEDGTNPSWKHIALGCQVEYNSVSYTVLGIERAYQNRTTKLRMQLTSRFAFEEVGTVNGGNENGDAEMPSPPIDTATVVNDEYIVSGVVTAGDAVMVNTNGSLAYAVNNHEVYGLTIGIALQSGADGDSIHVALPGTVVRCNRYTFTKGERIFIRAVPEVSLNITQELLLTDNAETNEDTVIIIGVAVNTNSFVLQHPESYIYEELL